MSHVTHMNESCHTYEWVMAHIWITRLIHICLWSTRGTWPTHLYTMTHLYVWHDSDADSVDEARDGSHMNESFHCTKETHELIDVFHDSITRVTWWVSWLRCWQCWPSPCWITYEWVMLLYKRYPRTNWCVPWLIHTCDMMCAMTHSILCAMTNSMMCVPWLI